MKLTWKRLLKFYRSVISWSPLSIIILVTVSILYTLPWTGLGDYITPTGNFIRGKTLWDWMELLIIPLALAFGAYYLNRSERNTEREIATDRQRETALQSYLDRMAELLLKDKLRTARNKEVQNVARTRTLTVLRGLDSPRKKLVLQFLHEANLISTEKTIVNLSDANLSGVDMGGAKLSNVNLSGAYLYNAVFISAKLRGVNMSSAILSDTDFRGADLSSANMSGAYLLTANLNLTNLSNANLSGAKLYDANLNSANFNSADLSGAYLKGAYLHNADLSNANLKGAEISDEQLTIVKSLKDATMPDGTKHE